MCKPWKKIGVLLKGQGNLKPIYKNVNVLLTKCQHLPHICPFVINASFPFLFPVVWLALDQESKQAYWFVHMGAVEKYLNSSVSF